MTLDPRLEKITLGFALGLPCLTSLALMFWAPGTISPGTYAIVVSLLLGTATVALNTWKSAQATGSMGQLIYEVNTAAAPTRAQTRWNRWAHRYDGSAARGRVVAVMMLSVATTAVIVATWLA